MYQLCDLSFGNFTNQNVIMEYMFADNDIIMAAKVLAYMFNLEELVHIRYENILVLRFIIIE